ncbi:MAG: tRNA uridine-5-carboxymethylaminomethyl(34) synthesis enzyme MnmG [Planctomycetota bacterium]|nr:tRNA uridine-5-carboxymethylaminomethyl(34) synthesis enzyme MnmG [Planctomycetota bacterium]
MSGSGPSDLVVVGGGHAGVEAALAAARMGASVRLVTLDPGVVGRMSCNPAIGGLGKGQMVREIDALGGEMGRAADATGIQFRLLNTRKGPAVRAPRCQSDKKRYQDYMVRVTRATPGLEVVAGKVEALLLDEGAGRSPVGRVRGVRLADGSEVVARAVLLTNGTFLRGLMHCGEKKTRGGRVGEDAAYGLSDFLEDLGFERGRLKTGTPPRVESSTIDYAKTRPQPGDDPPVPFSHFTETIPLRQIECHISHTSEATHEVIRRNLHRAPMYSGAIEGVGPRYCPSIEDKVVRFADKERHQIFLEPEGLDSSWVYLNGISTSLPEDVQDDMLATIPALRSARVHQYGYAVEYDFFPPTQIRATFETRLVEGLYFAGQICGTSGYEEAAAQGLLAGVNTVLASRDEEPLVIDRARAYLGVLVDDLVRECPREPYRMFTSRAEYRLLLRSDNADRRLMALGHRLGLVPDDAFERLERKERAIQRTLETLESGRSEGKSLLDVARRPGRTVPELLALAGESVAELSPEVLAAVDIEVKYAPYIERQRAEVERFLKLERRLIPEEFDYHGIRGIRLESREKLSRLRPRSVGQASRVSGVTPADLAVILAHLERARRAPEAAAPGAGP